MPYSTNKEKEIVTGTLITGATYETQRSSFVAKQKASEEPSTTKSYVPKWLPVLAISGYI